MYFYTVDTTFEGLFVFKTLEEAENFRSKELDVYSNDLTKQECITINKHKYGEDIFG